MATVLTLTANPLLDHLAEATVVAGAVNRTSRFVTVAGGKGLNVGRVLVRHGHRVLAAGFAGGEPGRQLATLAAADGLEPVFTTTAARTRLGFLAVHPAGGTTSLMEGGATVEPAEAAALVEQVRSLLAGVALVVMSGSVPDATCTALYRQVLDACARVGVPCWVDAYGPAMDAALAGANPPLLAKPNAQEYAGDHRRWLACRELHLTDGSQGVRVRHPEGRYRVLPPPVIEVNPIGCGDTYVAALAHARLTGLPLIEQLRYAAAAGAANAARADVAQVGPADIAPLLDGVRIEALAGEVDA